MSGIICMVGAFYQTYKVVNMRQVVKRSKVHVISKLCKHITALKKKKGTDEQRTKNLRKAERLIEEIESIKKLKEDKVSKYALANTASFAQVSKMSLLPGPRAMARLADHTLMKKVVTDFREQHSDWRDLAAYLLIKQTGRRFKTKKQKQKKLSRCVENINASETMTKAYIQERFGQEGLAKAEQRFERKRKRHRSVVNTDAQNKDEFVNNQEKETENDEEFVKKDTEDFLEKHEPDVLRNNEGISPKQKKKKKRVDQTEILTTGGEFTGTKNSTKFQESIGSTKKHSVNGGQTDELQSSKAILNNIKSVKDNSEQEGTESSSEDSENENMEHSDISKEKVTDTSEKHSDNNLVKFSKVKAKHKKECVVKQLKLGGRDESDDSDDDDEEEDSSKSSGSQEEDGSDLGSESNEESDENEEEKKENGKRIPEFLTTRNKAPIADPFFAGSDDDDGGEVETEEVFSDNNVSDEEDGKGRMKAESMFHSPHSESGSSRWSHRGRDSSDRRGDPGRFGRGNRRGGTFRIESQRGRGGSFRNDSRGRGNRRGGSFSTDGQGRGNQKGRDFRTERQGRGSSRGSNRKFTGHDKSGGRFNEKDFQQSATRDRLSEKNNLDSVSADYRGSTAQKKPNEKLHPSWEASKKRKAEQSGLKAFQGNRITFDDD